MIKQIMLGTVAFLAAEIGATPTWAASPTPISACPYTISAPGNYAVTKNLTAIGGCILITADNVGLDLQGHSITGDGANGRGISNNSNNYHIIIANGTVQKFDTGIFLAGDFNTVSGMTVNDNTGNNNSNLADGIILAGGGNEFSSNTVVNSKALRNAQVGIGCQGCNLNTIVSNSQADNNGTGIIGFDTIVDSDANYNQGHGIFVFSGSVTGSTATGNGLSGIVVQSNGSIINSIASNNVNDGMDIGFGHAGIATITGSVAKNNIGRGIALECPASAFGNTALRNAGGNLTTTDSNCVLLNNKTQ